MASFGSQRETHMSEKQTIYAKCLKRICRSGKIGGIDIVYPFEQVCLFLKDNPESLSWRAKSRPSLTEPDDIDVLAKKFVDGYKRSDFPAQPGTVPDEMVSIVMQVAYGYSKSECQKIKTDHQYSMCAENCVGALLERYLDSIMRSHGWVWCCGDFVKAVDFILPTNSGWDALQIKNRDNSENSSSSAIRNNTDIQKWFRTFSQTGKTNWDNLPPMMQGKGLSEDGFIEFVKKYLKREKKKLSKN
jgi:hypothetical protein